jgi:shikimate dehydrogenase
VAVKRLAVLGHPVAHSRSPAMQNAALAELGLAGEWSYEAIDVAPAEFEQRLRAMPAEGFVGANVTVPHKEEALAAASASSRAAREIGAANTLSFEDGQVHAENTDAPGLLAALPAAPRGGRALVLGAGGAARAVVWALTKGGAIAGVDLAPFEVDVWNRTRVRAERTLAELGKHVELRGGAVKRPRQQDYAIVVNTTSVGLRDEDPFVQLPLDPGGFDGQVVVDMVYGDRPSRLLEVAKETGAYTVDGLEVLLQQGARSLEIWTGLPAPLARMREAVRA